MRLALALALVLVAGCDVEASLGSHDAGADGSAPLDSSAPTDAAPTDASPTDASAIDASPIDGSMPTCGPPDGGACVACEAAMCCGPFMACALAPTCPCIVDCVLAGHTVEECTTHCGGADHGEHDALLTCTEGHCASACP